MLTRYRAGPLDTTVRVKYTLSSHPTLTDASALSALLAPHGPVDEPSIVLSLKPAPPKKPKRGTALVPFKQIRGAFAAVCASGRPEHGLADVEVTWAEGKEPELIGWLKRMGQLGGAASGKETGGGKQDPASSAPLSADYKPAASNTTTAQTSSNDTFSSFPTTFVRPLFAFSHLRSAADSSSSSLTSTLHPHARVHPQQSRGLTTSRSP